MDDLYLTGRSTSSQRPLDRLIKTLKQKGIRNQHVLDVIRKTPRHAFVDEALAHKAYENKSLPIGHQQTISQPYIVARMTELLLNQEEPMQKVLEVGTGCGYQTTVLAQLVEQVYTTERINALLIQAKKRFRQLGLYNIRSLHTDGQWGWETQGPFDGIIVTAAPKDVPKALLSQLKVNGRLVIPVGETTRQRLRVLVRRENHFERQEFEPVSFVPLLGGQV